MDTGGQHDERKGSEDTEGAHEPTDDLAQLVLKQHAQDDDAALLHLIHTTNAGVTAQELDAIVGHLTMGNASPVATAIIRRLVVSEMTNPIISPRQALLSRFAMSWIPQNKLRMLLPATSSHLEQMLLNLRSFHGKQWPPRPRFECHVPSTIVLDCGAQHSPVRRFQDLMRFTVFWLKDDLRPEDVKGQLTWAGLTQPLRRFIGVMLPGHTQHVEVDVFDASQWMVMCCSDSVTDAIRFSTTRLAHDINYDRGWLAFENKKNGNPVTSQNTC